MKPGLTNIHISAVSFIAKLPQIINTKKQACFILIIFIAISCLQKLNAQMEQVKWPDLQPPTIVKKTHVRDIHGDKVSDDYYWMIDFFKKGPDSNEVVKHLEAENNYLKEMMADTKTLQEDLYKEMRGRIKEKDENVPYFRNGYFYYTRSEEGQQYYKLCRKKGSLNAPEEIMLDIDAMAEGHPYYNVSGATVSPDNNLLVFGEDTVSRRQYNVMIKDLRTGNITSQGISNTSAGYVWAADSKTFFYTSNNPTTLLSEKVWRHVVESSVENDVMVYHEKDQSNYIGISKTKAENYILIESANFTNAEVRYLPADQPTKEFAVFQPRMEKVLYSVDADTERFYITHNKEALNFKISVTPFNETKVEHWKDFMPHRKEVLVENLLLLKDVAIIKGRKNGLDQLEYVNKDGKNNRLVPFEDAVYMASFSTNADYNATKLRYSYSSPITPSSVFDYDLTTGKTTLLKQREIPSGYNKNDYDVERVFATASDGTKIPISIAYKKGFKKDGNQPFLLIGYGSYGFSYPTYFNSNLISLMDRGFAYGIAHIRGGQEMGRQWYEDGKMMKKKNTFTDFITCAGYLIKEKYTSPKHLYANGGSAGGLLMGTAANMGNTLFNGIIADVPFVDVVNTMLDPTIPLTTNEYDQWGNPETSKEAYLYMKSYSPYENIEKKAYPNILATTGLHDSQVQYFEPEKWVAKLREYKTNTNVVMLQTNMEFGHGGASGRFDYLKKMRCAMRFY
ncbi:S9 family peptidase [Niabella ginsengisoli]|uniref:S9 family peptidase n=1 Tax=Niabella ginsengisoli TaxID=522298 RepID=A0ABS9SPW8_9BACT|nr:S9 family peptidase [Niabella ginsengisoli]MCH5600311.1 S9 family peptidase [Niabella ginsengisoli]